MVSPVWLSLGQVNHGESSAAVLSLVWPWWAQCSLSSGQVDHGEPSVAVLRPGDYGESSVLVVNHGEPSMISDQGDLSLGQGDHGESSLRLSSGQVNHGEPSVVVFGPG